MNTREINLCGIGYRVTETDGQVIFEEQGCFHGVHSRFTYEWNGLFWAMVDMDAWSGDVMVAHLAAAGDWVEKNYSVEWIDGRGTVTMKQQIKPKQK